MAVNRNFAGISGIANPETQASGTRALVQFLQNLSTDIYGPPGTNGTYGALNNSLRLNQQYPQSVYGGTPKFTSGIDMDNSKIDNVDYIDFNLDYADGVSEGRLQRNSEDGLLEYGLPGSSVNLSVGNRHVERCKNETGTPIPKGSVVYITGASGQKPTIALADADVYVQSFVLGITLENITTFGWVATLGKITGLDTSLLTEGAPIWLSQTAGGLTSTRPISPAMSVFIGYCIYQHATEGKISIRPTLVPRLNGLSDVYVPSPSETGQIMHWNQSNLRYELVPNILVTDGNVSGGSTASNNLTLNSTTNATKGKILFGSSGAYDELNDRFSIGLQNTQANLAVVSGGSGSDVIATYDMTTLMPLTNMNQGGSGNANFLFYSITGDVGAIIGGLTSFYSKAGAGLGVKTTSQPSYYKKLAVAGGIEAVDIDSPTLGSECLTNGALTSGTSWTAGGDVTLANNRAEFVYSTGATTYIRQTAASLATAIVANSWYVFQYDVTNFVAVPGKTNPSIGLYADNQLVTATALDITSGLVYFKTGPSYTKFEIRALNMVSGHSFNMDNLSLKQITSGGSITSPADFTVKTPTQKTLVLEQPTYNDIQFSISTGKVPAANFPDYTTFTTNTQEFAFGVNEYIDLQANEIEHRWKEGTDYEPHLHLALKSANGTGSNRYAKFTIYLAYAYTGDVWTETSFDAELTIPTGSSALQAFYLTFGSKSTFASKTIGTQMKVRIKRIAATGGTEFADDIFITQCGFHIQTDTIGSRQQGTK